MNIAFLISSLSLSGGTQRILSCLCNLLIYNYNIYIIVNDDHEPFFDLDSRIKIVNIPKSNSKFNILNNNLYIYRILKDNNIVYYINLDANSIAFTSMFLPRRTKLVLWEHFALSTNFKKLHFIFSRHYAAIRCSSLVLISNSEMENWHHYNFLSKSKSKLIYNPLCINSSDLDKLNKYHKQYLLAIGNDIHIKGFDILLKAWKFLNTDKILRIIGLDIESINKLKINIQHNNLKNIELYGKEKNIEKFYESSSLFLLPSRKEATPLVLIESQAFGIPAIVFNNLPGVLELVDDSAITVEYDESGKSFKEAIENVIGDEVLYNTLHLNAIKNSLRFTKTKFKEEWMKLLS